MLLITDAALQNADCTAVTMAVRASVVVTHSLTIAVSCYLSDIPDLGLTYRQARKAGLTIVNHFNIWLRPSKILRYPSLRFSNS